MTYHSILQWNCRGIKANFNELHILLQECNISVLCLQETKLSPNSSLYLKHYSSYHVYSKNISDGHPSGGVSTFIHNSIPHSVIPLNTTLQAQATLLTLDQTITICNIYLPPNINTDFIELDNLVQQLPSPYILLGDLNAHHPMWGCCHQNIKGNLVEQLLLNHSLVLLNNKQHTYVHPATGTTSALDLTFSTPALSLNYKWTPLEDLHGSDHFPILLTPNTPCPDNKLPYWKLTKANWNSFKKQCSNLLQESTSFNTQDPILFFTNTLISIANNTIPKTSTKNNKPNKPWINDDCKQAINERKSALRNLRHHPTITNLETLRIKRAKARRTIRTAKKNSWQSFVSKINKNTPMRKIWNMIHKIQGKNVKQPIKHLNVNGQTISQLPEIANTIASTISYNSSTKNYSPNFQKYKTQAEQHTIYFTSDNTESYNHPIQLEELKDAINSSKDSTPGPDNIHYQLLKHLPPCSLQLLLSIFNHYWTTDTFPSTWHNATVIPIPKPGKDHTNPTNYRPIALTSCLCKIFEKILNARLMWFLEYNKFITPEQSGFRKQRGTVDHLVRLESYIRDAFAQKQHVIAVFFDLEKAYDMTWKYGILQDLKNCGAKGHLPIFIQNYLSNRKFNVRLSATFSEEYDQEAGVPQGGILSTTLFILKINNITNCLSQDIEKFLYVDDFVICFRSKYTNVAERKLQLVLNKLTKWADCNGFKFSKDKTCVVHFCNQRKLHPDPTLLLNNHPLPVVKEVKFLGLYFDNKLSFLPHIKYLKTKCLQAMNLFKIIAHQTWGADQNTLLTLYRTLIRSKLDYGAIIYGSARKSYLKILEPVANQALRICLGAFRTSPVSSLQVLAHEPPLNLRREQLSLQYCMKLKSTKLNPTHKTVFQPQTSLYRNKPNAIPSLGVRIQSTIPTINIMKLSVANHQLSPVPPWLLTTPTILFDLLHTNTTQTKKSSTVNDIYISKYREIRDLYPQHTPIFTDGSKQNDHTATAVVLNSHTITKRLPNSASIYTAELYAILLSLNEISKQQHKYYIIFSDSLSSLHTILSKKLEHPITRQILLQYHKLASKSFNILFCWLPSHVGITGNEKADKAAKSALNKPILRIPVPFTDLKPIINKYIRNKWQQDWNSQTQNKLQQIFPIIPPQSTLPSSFQRKDQIVYNRLRIGHTRLTHSYLIDHTDPPECTNCHQQLSVKHILTECISYNQARQQSCLYNNLKDIFNHSPTKNILNFIKNTNLHDKL